MSEQLTQKEIEEMIAGQTPALSPSESDTLGEISNISMGSAATALYSILGKKVTITTPEVEITTLEKLAAGHEVPYLVVSVGYTEGFAGSNLFILQIDDVKAMTDIMMGGDGHPDMEQELSELHISAISEAMNQMMGGMATAMADMFNRKVNITPPDTQIVRLSDQEIRDFFKDGQTSLIKISFKMEIEGLLDSGIMQLMPMEFGQKLAAELNGSAKPAAPAVPAAPPPQPAKSAAPLAAAKASPAKSAPPVDVRPIQLTSFDDPNQSLSAITDSSIDLILDVPLMITVELGQCRKTIKDVLELNIGSVIALDKLAGEPVDVVANGKAVAKGEVIVIDDSYGIRITEVLSSASRIRAAR